MSTTRPAAQLRTTRIAATTARTAGTSRVISQENASDDKDERDTA